MIGITHENRLETDISLNVMDFSRYKWWWVDFHDPTEDEIKHLSETFHFHPLAIEDCVQRLQRPKLDYYENHTFYISHIVRDINGTLVKGELDFFVGENFIVTYHQMPTPEVDQVRNDILSQENRMNWNSLVVFHQILDNIVDNYFPLIYKIEDALDKIEDITENKSMNDLMSELYDSRKRLLNLRHTIDPMRDLLYRMLNSNRLSGIMERREYFSDIYDHLLKLSEMVTANREVTTDIRDSYLSLNSHQTNNVMKILTIMTSIFSPLTLIAGIYGMNFENMPELTWKYGYFFIVGLMGIIGVSMYLWFRKKGWF